MFTRKCSPYLAVAAAAAVTSFSISADPSEVVGHSRAVKVWDLDLANGADVQRLYERVQSAANEVCRAEIRQHRRETRTDPPYGWAEACVKRAVDEAVREAGNRRLAALHQETPRG